MGNYQFEVNFTLSELIDVEADSYDEAMDMVRDEADAYYPVAPQGYSLSWDDIRIDLIDSDGEDW